MRFSFSSAAALLLAATTYAQSTPSPAKILADLAQTSKDLVALNNTLNGFKANSILTLPTALYIQTESDTIVKDLNKSIADANAVKGQFSDDDTLAIATAVANLEPVITGVLNNIVVHKPAFSTAFFGFGDLSKTVRADLVQQQSLVGSFGAALAPHASTDYASIAPLLTQEVQGLFTTAIAAYDKCTGPVCLPPINF